MSTMKCGRCNGSGMTNTFSGGSYACDTCCGRGFFPAPEPPIPSEPIGMVTFDCTPPTGVPWDVHRKQMADALLQARAMLVLANDGRPGIRPVARAGAGAFALAVPVCAPFSALFALEEDASLEPYLFSVRFADRSVEVHVLNAPVHLARPARVAPAPAAPPEGRRFDLDDP